MAVKLAMKKAAGAAAGEDDDRNGRRSRRESAVEMREVIEEYSESTSRLRQLLEERQREDAELRRLLSNSVITGAAAPTRADSRATGVNMDADAVRAEAQRIIDANRSGRGMSMPTMSAVAARAAEDPQQGDQLVTTQVKTGESIVNFYTLVAAGVSFLPGGFGLAAVFTTQVLMLRSIAQAFGQNMSGTLASTIVSAGIATLFDAGLVGGAKLLAMVALPGTFGGVLSVIASPAAAVAATQALGKVVLQQLETSGTRELTRGLAEHVRTRMADAFREAQAKAA